MRSPELSTALRTLSRQSGATAFMVALAVFEVLLGRYTGQEDLAVGTPVAGRHRAEVEGLIGLFINTLVLRGDLAGTADFTALLDRVRETAIGAYGHQELPFEKVVEDSPRSERSAIRLFFRFFILQNTPPAVSTCPGSDPPPQVEAFSMSRFDISLTVFDNGLQSLVVGLQDRAVRRRPSAAGPGISRPCRGPHGRSRPAPSRAAAADRRGEGADPARMEPAAGRLFGRGAGRGFVHRMFEAQAGKTPDAVAVVFAAEALSYRELKERANRFAQSLRDLGVGPESTVGISAERTLDLAVGLLGMLKTGGAYVPLDPGLSADRLAFMMADAGIVLLLTQERLLPALPTTARGSGRRARRRR